MSGPLTWNSAVEAQPGATDRGLLEVSRTLATAAGEIRRAGIAVTATATSLRLVLSGVRSPATALRAHHALRHTLRHHDGLGHGAEGGLLGGIARLTSRAIRHRSLADSTMDLAMAAGARPSHGWSKKVSVGRAVDQLAAELHEYGERLTAYARKMRDTAARVAWQGHEGEVFHASVRDKAYRCEIAATDLRRTAAYLEQHLVAIGRVGRDHRG